MNLTTIAIFHSMFKSKFGIPRQSGIIPDLAGQIVFEPDYRNEEFTRGLDSFDFLWIIWGFSANRHQSVGTTVRPPRLGGNKRVGVFATRSPYRPNPIGLSSVRIHSFDYSQDKGITINVEGADLLDGTPIYDIKPYIEFTDSHNNIRNGFVDKEEWKLLKVLFTKEALLRYNTEQQRLIQQILQQDPRPQYHDDSNRVYGISLNNDDVHFQINGNECVVL